MIKLEDLLSEDFSQRKRNFKSALRMKLMTLKNGSVMTIGKLTWTKEKNNWKNDKTGKVIPGQLLVNDLTDFFRPAIKSSPNYNAADVLDKIKFK